jgi:hypothetical protein
VSHRANAVALSLLSIATTAASVGAQPPAVSPLRVAVVFRAKADVTPEESQLLRSVEKAIEKSHDKKVVFVEASAAADAVVDVWHRQSRGAAPGSNWDIVHAKVDGRELEVFVPGVYNAGRQRERWEFAGTQLGQDVGVVLKLRTRAPMPVTVEALVTQLSGRDPAQRAQAANQIERMGTQARAALPALLAVLGDHRPLRVVGAEVFTTPAKEAAKALLALGADAELTVFVQSKADDHARAEALATVAAGRSAGSPDVVLRALDDRSPVVRTRAAGLAGVYAGRRAVPRLIEILDQARYVEMRDAARRSLRLVAGKDLELNADAWRQWWAEQERRR